jgi:hypothetical protein
MHVCFDYIKCALMVYLDIYNAELSGKYRSLGFSFIKQKINVLDAFCTF